jgi:hypothetical protein
VVSVDRPAQGVSSSPRRGDPVGTRGGPLGLPDRLALENMLSLCIDLACDRRLGSEMATPSLARTEGVTTRRMRACVWGPEAGAVLVRN